MPSFQLSIIKRILTLLICALFPIFVFANDLNESITRLYLIKRSSPLEFEVELKRLKEKKSLLSGEQLNHIRYFDAYLALSKGRVTDAMKIGEGVLDSSHDINILMWTHILIGSASVYTNSWQTGINSLLYVSSNVESISDQHLKNASRMFVAYFYTQSKSFDESMEQLSGIAKEELDNKNKCLWYSLMAEALAHKKIGPISSDIRDSGIFYCEYVEDYYLSRIINTLYLSSHINHNPTYSISGLSELLEEPSRFGKAMIEPGIYAYLSQAYISLGQLDEAEKNAKLALEYKDSTYLIKSIIDAYYVLYQTGKRKGNYKSALENYLKYSEENSKYLSELEARSYSVKLAEYKYSEIQRENNNLSRENELLQTKEKLAAAEAENHRLFIILLSCVLLLLCLFLYRSRKTQLRLKQLAEYDALTGVYNRGHFTHIANSALQYSKDGNQKASCILLDLDFFKNVNDSYGHAVGDWALKQVARVCKELARKNDIFARIGGEEFSFVLLGCDKETAEELSEKCRVAISLIDSSETGHDFTLSASFGVTDSEHSGYKLEKLLADADLALYSAKENGRNQLVIYHPQLEASATTLA